MLFWAALDSGTTPMRGFKPVVERLGRQKMTIRAHPMEWDGTPQTWETGGQAGAQNKEPPWDAKLRRPIIIFHEPQPPSDYQAFG